MAVPGPLYLDTSGWVYRDWAAGFYAGSPAKTWLKSYAERFNSVEVNRTFYRQVRSATLETWHRETPADFRFSLKAHRYLTHVRRLRFGPEALHRQKTAASPLGGKRAAVLWQLPPGLSHDPARLESFFSLLREWREVPHVIEFRHASWFRETVAEALRREGHAVCLSDAADWPLWDRVTANRVYLRLHGHDETYRSNYGDSALIEWAGRIASWRGEGRTVQVYFDNTDTGAAWRNAERLGQILGLLEDRPEPPRRPA